MLILGAASIALAQGRPARRAPELDRLGFLTGTYAGEVQLFPGDSAPPTVGRMSYTAAWELDSSWVLAHYELSTGAATLRGILQFTWVARPGHYVFYGFANAPMEPTRMTGTMDSARLVFETPAGGTLAYRETWEAVGGDTLRTMLEYRRGERWILGSRAVLVRNPAASSRPDSQD
jgi:hypothetical protein